MDISRVGAERNRGRTSIIPKLTFTPGTEIESVFENTIYWKDNVCWDSHAKAIVINANWIATTDGKAHHNYKIKLTLEDIAALIDIVGHAGAKTDAKLLRDSLAKNIPAIVKLLACATGLQPFEISNDETSKKTGVNPKIAVKKTPTRRS